MGQCHSGESVGVREHRVSTMKFGNSKANVVQMDKKTRMLFDMIKDIPCLSGLTENTKRRVVSKLQRADFVAGQAIMRFGETGNSFYLLSQGACSVFNSEGLLIASLRSGDFFGEQALIHPNSTRTATVKAVSDCVCFTLDNETFQSMSRVGNLNFVNRNSGVFGKTKGENIFNDEDDLDEEDEEEVNERHPKMTDQVLNRLCESVENNVLFQGISKDDLRTIMSKCTLREYTRDSVIITQGDQSTQSDEFFIIHSGKCEVIKNGSSVATIGKSHGFGELALAFRNPRSATVRAIEKTECWVLKRRQFQRTLRKVAEQTHEERVNALKQVPLLRTLNYADLSKFGQCLSRVTYQAGHVFFKQGDRGDQFFIIIRGMVSGVQVNSDGSEKQFELEEGEFFGELALRFNKPRSATVVAHSKEVECFVAGKSDFDLLFGSFDNALERVVEEYHKNTQSSKEYRTGFLMNRSLEDFERGSVIGRGKYGEVCMVRDPQSGTVYALKSVKKTWVQSKNKKQSKRRIRTLFNERDVLRSLNDEPCRFIVKLRGTFKNQINVYFLMECAEGGDLFNVLKTRGYVDEKTARFYLACVVEGLHFLHERNILHRDLKPENIVLDHRGYGMITDFGFSKQLPSSHAKTYTLCGTPGYLAPEVILGSGYGKGSDWFSSGALLFDCLTGAPPFPTRTDQFSMIQSMMSGQFQIPVWLSFWCKDLLRNLLQLKPMKRYGVVHGGTQKIRMHKWFEGFDWESLRQGTMKAPIQPAVKTGSMSTEGFDTSDIDAISKEMDAQHDRTPLPKDLQNWDLTF